MSIAKPCFRRPSRARPSTTKLLLVDRTVPSLRPDPARLAALRPLAIRGPLAVGGAQLGLVFGFGFGFEPIFAQHLADHESAFFRFGLRRLFYFDRVLN